MSYIYRYTDLSDSIIKYVGIVWGKTRSLYSRINEHKKDKWYFGKNWLIEYAEEEVRNKSEAEAFESHLISVYNSPVYNIAKVGWGINRYLPTDLNWKVYDETIFNKKSKYNVDKSKKQVEQEEIFKKYDTKWLYKELQSSIKDYKDRIELLNHIISHLNDEVYMIVNNYILKPMTILKAEKSTYLYFQGGFVKYGIISKLDEDGDLTLSFTKRLNNDFIEYALRQVNLFTEDIKCAELINHDSERFDIYEE